MSPVKSKAQDNLMRAAAHNAQFPMAKQVRSSMTMGQLGDFAKTPTKGLPAHVKSASHPIRNLKHFAHPKRSK